MEADLCLSAVRGETLAEYDGWGSSHPNRELRQDWCQDGSALLVPPDTEQKNIHTKTFHQE